VPAACLLNDAPARPEDLLLPRDLPCQGFLNESKGVDVLELDPRAEDRRPYFSNRDVGVTTERPFLEIAIVHPEKQELVATRAEVPRGPRWRAQVGLPDDFDERCACAVQIDDGSSPQIVEVLPRILFHMDAREPCAFGDRLLSLADLELDKSAL